MNCPAQRDWILFYYGDLESQKAKELKKHLIICPSCRKEYEKMGDFLNAIAKDKVKLDDKQLSEILEKVMKRTGPHIDAWVSFKENLNYGFEGIIRLITYKPQVVFAALVILFSAIFISFNELKDYQLTQESIVEMEDELILEDDFDLGEMPFDVFTRRQQLRSNYCHISYPSSTSISS
jgi:hypothetical protein